MQTYGLGKNIMDNFTYEQHFAPKYTARALITLERYAAEPTIEQCIVIAIEEYELIHGKQADDYKTFYAAEFKNEYARIQASPLAYVCEVYSKSEFANKLTSSPFKVVGYRQMHTIKLLVELHTFNVKDDLGTVEPQIVTRGILNELVKRGVIDYHKDDKFWDFSNAFHAWAVANNIISENW